jgi:predicted CxxxxCH...CXXCH cytochrome family protein
MRASATCGSTYCHGATLAAGGRLTAPVWTTVDGTQAACGTCHGSPPPAPHPASTACHQCHSSTVGADGEIDLARGTHVNGTLELDGLGCTGCHGSDTNAAPPLSTRGESDPSLISVGAHQAHVRDGALRRAVDCGECHVLPDRLVHSDGAVDLAWGPLATSDGASPAWTRASATCSSTYCHGATLAAGGGVTAPVWTTVDGTQTACGTCHGSPPPSPHPANPLCNACHPLTVAVDGTIDVAGGRHIDGTVDVEGLTCSSCHGSTENPAPPLSSTGESETTLVAVGAHQAHVRGGTIRAAMACTECHVLPAVMLHSSGTAELTFGELARTGEAAPQWTRASATCGSTYCHGATLDAGGALTAPVWTRVDGTQAVCGTCHGNPPPAPHPASADCSTCHPDTVAPDGRIDLAGGAHVNGRLEADVDCGACHGVPPPLDAHLAHAVFPADALPAYGDLGLLETTSPAGGVDYRFGCGHCHPLDPAKHMNRALEVELSPAAAPAGSLRARNSALAAFDRDAGACSGVYCHSGGQAAPVYAVTPGWRSGASLGCAGCHGNPPAYPSAGPGVPGANSHLGLASGGREWGHYAGLTGPNHMSKHGGGAHPPGEAASPITCQTCHFDTTDPARTGPSGFYWLDTAGQYALAGGDPARAEDPRWQVTQCRTCHAPGGAPEGAGAVRPLRHVNGRADVVFDPRTALPPYAGLPAAPATPTRPYWVTHATACDPLPADATLDGTTLSFHLAGARFDPATKTCSGVACHLGEPAVWGRVLVTGAAPDAARSCCRCHAGRCGP